MKLTHIRVKDFRSFSGEHEFEVASGVNYFVGPNNCGKSNLIRALELSLDPEASYSPETDRPSRPGSVGAPPTTRITLTFQVGNTPPEKTLLTRAKEYELGVRRARKAATTGNIQTYAGDRELRVVTSFVGQGARQTTFQAKGYGAASLPSESKEHLRLEAQFRALVRFAVVHSGEDLESLLKGKFRQILQLVIADHLADQLVQAESARADYLGALQEELLEPLRNKVQARVGSMFPEISAAQLIPDLPSVAETLAEVDVQLGDSVLTQLTSKGTGVRGVVLVSMLQYLAEQSRRSLVLAVEEPEAFLHPGAQEEIMEQLDELARRNDVSLLVTTHSPYVISRKGDALITELRKRSGVTSKAATCSGDEGRAELLGSLYRDAGMAGVLERALKIPAATKGVIITEGFTDAEFLRMGCEAAGQPELLDGLHFISAGGAKKVVVQAILARSATAAPVVALLDADEQGRSAQRQLVEFGWLAKRDVLSLNSWPERCKISNHDIEIEDLIPAPIWAQLIKVEGEGEVLDAKEKCGSTWHFRVSKAGKENALERLPSLLKKPQSKALVWLAQEIIRRVVLMEKAAESARVHRVT